MKVDALLFARLRDVVGTHVVTLTLDEGTTPEDAWQLLVAQHPRLDGLRAGLRVAVDEEYAAWDTSLRPGGVVAFIPPVAGGSVTDTVHARVMTGRIDAAAVEAAARTRADGAVCTFTGVVRESSEGRPVTALEYEAYIPMAEAELARVATEAVRRFGVTAVAVEHRVGTLSVGDVAVVVAVSAPHRAEAFEACRWCIDTVKEQVPIWKREHGPGGAVWVEGCIPGA